MNSYESFSAPKGSTRWLLWTLIFIFLSTLTTFTILEVRSLNGGEPSVIRIVMNTIRHPNGGNQSDEGSHKFVLVNVANAQQDEDELVRAIVTQVEGHSADLERRTREAVDNKTSNGNKNSYYEEQTPVVVYSKTEQDNTPLSYRQSAPVPYQHGSHEQQPYYDGDGYDNGDYASDDGGSYRPQYDDDSREDIQTSQDYGAEQDSDEARSAAQKRQYDAYYRQWHYATPAPPTSSSASRSTSLSSPSQENRKSQALAAAAAAGGMRDPDPYAAYVDDYDYMQSHRSPARPQHYQQQQTAQQRYRPQASTQAVQKKEDEGHEMNFMSILKTLKMMWDLYQSFASAWNSMAEQRNKQVQLAKQKYRQQQQQQKLRINSKKPPAINSKNKAQNPTKNPKNTKQSTSSSTTTSTTISSSTEEETETEAQADVPVKPQKLQKAKVEPRKGSKGDKTPTKDAAGLRKRRQANDDAALETTDVGEGRYIKGDPLKGYYDFVITEGSYKFWAAFQVGTALLIIYSTFAAIYYSKVNPLVSDYDYTDYLGGARSLSGGDLDFVDDETSDGSEHNGVQHSRGWSGWLPRTGHSLKFILDAIDKLPVDHAVNRDDAVGEEDVNDDDNAENLGESTKNKAM